MHAIQFSIANPAIQPGSGKATCRDILAKPTRYLYGQGLQRVQTLTSIRDQRVKFRMSPPVSNAMVSAKWPTERT